MNHRNLGIQKSTNSANTGHFNDGLTSLNNTLQRRSAMSTNAITSTRLQSTDLNAIYKNGIGNRIVTIKSNTALKEGFLFDDETKEDVFNDKVLPAIASAMTYQLAFGRGVIIIIEKNKPLTAPLTKTIDINDSDVWLKTFSAADITATNPDLNLNSITYNQAQNYFARGNPVHISRVIDFTYVEPIDIDKGTYQYGGISEYELIYEQLVNDGVVQRASANILERSSIPYTKKKGYNDLLRDKNETPLLNYFSAMEDTKNILGQMIIDSEDEVGVVTQALTGLSDADNIVTSRISLVTGIPALVLLGKSPSGLGNGKDGELELFYTTISNYFNRYCFADIIELCKKLNIGRVTPKKPKEMSAKEEVDFETIAIDNAMKMRDLGEDYQAYLKSKGIELDEVSSVSNIFSDDEID